MRTHLYEWHKGNWLPISKNDMSTPTIHGTSWDYMGHELLWSGSQLDENWGRMQNVPPGLEPGTFRVWGERDNHYTTETDSSWKTETQCTHRHPVTRKQNKDKHWQRNMGISAHELVDTLLQQASNEGDCLKQPFPILDSRQPCSACFRPDWTLTKFYRSQKTTEHVAPGQGTYRFKERQTNSNKLKTVDNASILYEMIASW